MRPTSIYSITRNWDTDNLKTGTTWMGNENDTDTKVMAGLSASQGQLVTMDGGAKQSQDSDLGVSGPLSTTEAEEATGGVAKGNTSMAVLRGPGLQ